MEETFDILLQNYLDEEKINEKKELEENEYHEEEKEIKKQVSDISEFSEYSITIPEFVQNYLQETPLESLDNLTHKQFKELTKDNPLVIGIFNGDVDIDEILRQDYIIVRDCFGNLGSYLNPEKLRDFTRLDIVEKQYENVKHMRRLWCKHVMEYYEKYTEAYQEYMYLSSKCEQYEELIVKAKKANKVKKLKQFVDRHGIDSIKANKEE